LPPLEAWRGFTHSQRLHRRRATKMLGRVFMRQASRAFNSWSEAAHERRRALRFGRRLIDRGQVKALGSWQDFCHQRHRLRSTMRRILHANLARALNTWMEQATAHRRLRRFGRRLLGRVTSRALNGWLDFVRGKHKAMSQRRWAAARFGNPRLSAAWNQWLEGVPGSGMCCAEPKADSRRRTAEGGQPPRRMLPSAPRPDCCVP
jgi:hypothetical protein